MDSVSLGLLSMVFIFLQKEGKRNVNILENSPELFYGNPRGVSDKRNSVWDVVLKLTHSSFSSHKVEKLAGVTCLFSSQIFQQVLRGDGRSPRNI